MAKKQRLTEKHHKAYRERIESFLADINVTGQTEIYKRLIEQGFVTHESYPIGTYYSDVGAIMKDKTGLLQKPHILSAVFSVMGMSSDAVFGKITMKTPVLAQLDKDSIATLYTIIAKFQKETVKEPRKLQYDVMENAQTLLSLVNRLDYLNQWQFAIDNLFTNYSNLRKKEFPPRSTKMKKIEFVLLKILNMMPVDYLPFSDTQDASVRSDFSYFFFNHSNPNLDFFKYSVLLAITYEMYVLSDVVDLFLKEKTYSLEPYSSKKKSDSNSNEPDSSKRKSDSNSDEPDSSKNNFPEYKVKTGFSLDCSPSEKRKLQDLNNSLKKSYNTFLSTEKPIYQMPIHQMPIQEIECEIRNLLYFFLGISSQTKWTPKTSYSRLDTYYKKSLVYFDEFTLLLSDDVFDNFDKLKKLFEYWGESYKKDILPPGYLPRSPTPNEIVDIQETKSIDTSKVDTIDEMPEVKERAIQRKVVQELAERRKKGGGFKTHMKKIDTVKTTDEIIEPSKDESIAMETSQLQVSPSEESTDTSKIDNTDEITVPKKTVRFIRKNTVKNVDTPKTTDEVTEAEQNKIFSEEQRIYEQRIYEQRIYEQRIYEQRMNQEMLDRLSLSDDPYRDLDLTGGDP